MLNKIKIRYNMLKNFDMRLKKFSTDYFNELFEGNKNYVQVFKKYYDVYLNISILLNIISVLYLFLYAFCFIKAGDKISLWFNHLKGLDKILITLVALSAILLPFDFYRSLKYKTKTNKTLAIFSIVGYFFFACSLLILLIITIVVLYNEKIKIDDLISYFFILLITIVLGLGFLNFVFKLMKIKYPTQEYLLSVDNMMNNAYNLNQISLMLYLSIILLSVKLLTYGELAINTAFFLIIPVVIFIILAGILLQTKRYYVKKTLFNDNLLILSIMKVLVTVFFIIVCFHVLGSSFINLIEKLL